MRIEGKPEEIVKFLRRWMAEEPRTETVLTGTVYPLPPIQQPGDADIDRPDPLGLNQIRNDLRGNPGPPPPPLGTGPSIDEFRTYIGYPVTPEPIQRFEDPVLTNPAPAPRPFTRGRVGRAVERTPPEGRIVTDQASINTLRELPDDAQVELGTAQAGTTQGNP